MSIKVKNRSNGDKKHNPGIEKKMQKMHHLKVSGASEASNDSSVTSESLDDLSVRVKPVKVDAVSLAAQAEEIKNRVFGTAEDYLTLWFNVKELSIVAEDVRRLTDAEDQLISFKEEMQRLDAAISSKGQGVKNQFAFDLLLAYINRLNPKKDIEVLRVLELIMEGGPVLPGSIHNVHKRGQRASKSEIEIWRNLEKKPPFIAFKDDSGKRYIIKGIPSKMENNGKQSRADKVLFIATRNMVSRYFDFKKSKYEEALSETTEKINKMKLLVDENEHPVHYMLRGEIGLYTLFLPSDPRSKKGKDGAGQVVVKVLKGEKRTVVVEAVEGFGSMEFLSEKKGTWMPLWVLLHYRKVKELPEKYKAVRLSNFYLRLSKTLSRVIGYYGNKERAS